MYVCMYACMHACMHACMYICMYVCMYVCIYTCMYVCMYADKTIDYYNFPFTGIENVLKMCQYLIPDRILQNSSSISDRDWVV